ncbi:hypothetical protein BH11PSE9_BH11PSE9_03650 [soil metagenome]
MNPLPMTNSRRRGHCTAFAFSFAVLTGLAGCGALQGAKNLAKAAVFPTVEVLKITTKSDASINPDDKGNSLPVTVRVYQLGEINQLLQADYAGLLERDREVLGTSLLQRYEYVVYPQSASVQEFPIRPGARYLAVLAVMRKTPSPSYYLFDAMRVGTEGIVLQMGAQDMRMTAGPDPLRNGTEAGLPTPPKAPPAAPPAVKPVAAKATPA